jgi:nucleotidyltransferase/DNA polymerase involved in DNA repair
MIACVRIPWFAARLAEEEQPLLCAAPLLLTRTASDRARVVAVNRLAAQAGADAGMLVSRARALCPEAFIAPAQPDHWRRRLHTLMERLTVYSQYVDAERDLAQTATMYVDLGKLRPREGIALGEQMCSLLLEQGFTVSVGLASGKFTARMAAGLTDAVHLVPRGEEAAFLASHPVTDLPLDKETARWLTLLGLHHIGQLAILPAGALAAQLGAEGKRLSQLVRGDDPRRVSQFVPEQQEVLSQGFDPGVADRQIVDRVVTDLIQRLSGRLHEQGLTCRSLSLGVECDAGGCLEHSRRLREAISQSGVLSRMAATLLSQMQIEHPVTAVTVRLGQLAPAVPQQLSLFGESNGNDLRLKLLDITARYGDDRLYGISLVQPYYPLPELGFHLERVEVA